MKKEPEKKETPKDPTRFPCLSVRMSPALAAVIVNKLTAQIPVPTELGSHIVTIGSRMLLREWSGAPTGRADVVRVVEIGPKSLIVERTWGWHQGKLDDDVSALGLAVIPNLFPKVGYEE